MSHSLFVIQLKNLDCWVIVCSVCDFCVPNKLHALKYVVSASNIASH